MSPLIETRALSAGYGADAIVSGVSFTLAAGRTLALVGPNAAGKSTLIQALVGNLPPLAGHVFLQGDSLLELSPSERARRLSLVPQSTRHDLDFTVREMVAFGRSPHAGRWGSLSPDDEQLISEALESTDSAALENRAFSTLSGGERQRVLLARALAQRAPVLVLDEPTAHLDLAHQLLVIDRVREHAAAGGAALVVLHDLALAARLDEVAILQSGRLVARGAPEEVLSPARLSDIWGVRGALEFSTQGPPVLRLDSRELDQPPKSFPLKAQTLSPVARSRR